MECRQNLHFAEVADSHVHASVSSGKHWNLVQQVIYAEKVAQEATRRNYMGLVRCVENHIHGSPAVSTHASQDILDTDTTNLIVPINASVTSQGGYNPELIFGHLLTSTNYNDKTLKHVGGKNGYGAKLTNIFSKRFYVETSDGKKVFKQTYYDNMSRKDEPIITKLKTSQYTIIKYIPDYNKLKLDGLSDTMIKIMEKRAYDVASFAIDANVFFNSKKLDIKSFKQYSGMYISEDLKSVYEKVNDRWEIVVCLNETQSFESISFVNGINTSKGGKHVDYVKRQ